MTDMRTVEDGRLSESALLNQDDELFLNAFVELERDFSDHHGPFCLFGLFSNDKFTSQWDLVVSAPWLNEDKLEWTRELSLLIAAKLGEENFLRLSKLAVLDTQDPFVKAVTSKFRTEHGGQRYVNVSLNRQEFDEVFIITSNAQRGDTSDSREQQSGQ